MTVVASPEHGDAEGYPLRSLRADRKERERFRDEQQLRADSALAHVRHAQAQIDALDVSIAALEEFAAAEAAE